MLGVNNQPVFTLNTYTGKFDQTITDKQKLSFYWSDNERLRFNDGGHAYLPIPGNGSSAFAQQNIYGTMVRFSYDWTLTPTLLNHFAAGYNNFDNDHVSVSYGQNWPTKIGLTGVEDLTFPLIQFNLGTTAQGSAMTPMGNNTYGDSPNGSYIVTNDSTWVHGAHEIKFGVEVRKYYYVEPWNWGASGTFTFGPNTTADPNNLGTTGYTYAGFLLGDVTSANVPVEYINNTKTDTWNPALVRNRQLEGDPQAYPQPRLALGHCRWRIMKSTASPPPSTPPRPILARRLSRGADFPERHGSQLLAEHVLRRVRTSCRLRLSGPQESRLARRLWPDVHATHCELLSVRPPSMATTATTTTFPQS